MSPSRRMAASALLLLLMAVLVATEMGATKVAEAKTCLSESQSFQGRPCLSTVRCAKACKTENFPDGGECETQGFERKGGFAGKCFCKKLNC